MENKVYVGNLPYSVRGADLKELFSAAVENPETDIVSADVIMERENPERSKGFGFVEFSTPEFAQKAIEMFHEQEHAGRKLIVNIARPKEDRPRFDRGGDRGGNRGYQGGRNY